MREIKTVLSLYDNLVLDILSVGLVLLCLDQSRVVEDFTLIACVCQFPCTLRTNHVHAFSIDQDECMLISG